jgi:hypothetical protein
LFAGSLATLLARARCITIVPRLIFNHFRGFDGY